jgi:XTP/dITP diphosphohydrolase/tetrapyrrole methylase family protein/MazG family protein/ATP diphosphatase
LCDYGSGTFNDLQEIMRTLRAPGGCPWDAEQTLETLRRYILEEAHELAEAIGHGSARGICEESGDLLLQVVFVASIAKDLGLFDMDGVTKGICKKLVDRHPHVFGDVKVKDASDVSRNWEMIKAGERKGRDEDSSAMAGIPKNLPALLRAYRTQERAAKKGFDWPPGDVESVRNKVLEELDELRAEIENRSPNAMREEMGDLLFAMVNMSRHLDIDPESALQDAYGKFAGRFREVERQAEEKGVSMENLTLDELDVMWETAKRAKGNAV